MRLHYSLDAETELNEELITEAAQILSHAHSHSRTCDGIFSTLFFFLYPRPHNPLYLCVVL